MSLPFDSLLLVGCGRMGAGLAEIWADWRDGKVAVFDTELAKAERVASKFGLRTAKTAAEEAELAVLAVKPAHLLAALESLSPKVKAVVSIAAGVSCRRAATKSGGKPFIRAMPNVSVAVGGGITALYAPPAVADGLKARIGALFAFGGESFWLDDEAEIDIYTAFSGCGPAYVFHFVRALATAAEEMGVKNAAELSVGLLRGALPLLQAEKDPKALEERVKSPGGATEAALKVLEPILTRSLGEAMRAALAKVKDVDPTDSA